MGNHTGKKNMRRDGLYILLGAMVVCTLMVIAGCANKITPVSYQCPVIRLPGIPTREIVNLSDKSRPDEVIKAYVIDLQSCSSWVKTVQVQAQVHL